MAAQGDRGKEQPMNRAHVNGAKLEYEVTGAGEPTLLIHGAHLADGMAPLVDTTALEGFELIRYHRRGYAGSAHPAPASIAEHADDAAALVELLGHDRAHVIGHSSGAVIALELAARHPDRVRSLSLLEPAVLFGPAGAAFAEAVAPLVERYEAGDVAGAIEGFLELVGLVRWRETIEGAIPGAIEQAITDASTFFERELPAAGAWNFGRERASAIDCPVLSVLGTASGPFFEEGRQFLHDWFDDCTDADLPGVTHLLQMDSTDDVADAVGEFLRSVSPGKVVTWRQR
jgi:pimeloyl-ACP methyl ester carboxylesterase